MMELPELNNRIKEVVEYFTQGNVKAFAGQLANISQQRLDRIFKLDTRTGKFPSVPDDVLVEISKKFPEINLVWLLTGTGSMFTEGNNSNAVLDNPKDVTVAPLISQYAYAGYLAGFADHEYLDAQPTYVAARRHNGGHYVAFEVRGDSMDDGTKRSICEGDILLGRELRKDLWQFRLHVPKVFVIIHRTDGIICKEIIAHDLESGVITCHSWNPDPEYQDFEIDMRDVLQLFYVKEISRDNKY